MIPTLAFLSTDGLESCSFPSAALDSVQIITRSIEGVEETFLGFCGPGRYIRPIPSRVCMYTSVSDVNPTPSPHDVKGARDVEGGGRARENEKNKVHFRNRQKSKAGVVLPWNVGLTALGD